jgi:hypothetical protein
MTKLFNYIMFIIINIFIFIIFLYFIINKIQIIER